jgi:uncharacterized protein YndB with AHSA1/START domain
VLTLEPGVGGRLFETVEQPSGPRAYVMGTILAWDPPSSIAFEWRLSNFAPHESTRVDVRFRAAGESTLVTVQHSGFASLRDGHPARHGLVGGDFSRMKGLWWGDLMTALREHAAASRAALEELP